MSARARTWRPRRGGPERRLSGFRLPESQADWLERIAKTEGRSAPEVSRLLVQQGLKIYQRGSLLCDWPQCARPGCCDSGPSSGPSALVREKVLEGPGRVLPFPGKKGEAV